MPALVAQFRVLESSHSPVLQTHSQWQTVPRPSPRFQYSIFSYISRAALRHGSFSVLMATIRRQGTVLCLNGNNYGGVTAAPASLALKGGGPR